MSILGSTILAIACAGIAVGLSIIIYRAYIFRPPQIKKTPAEPISFDSKKMINNLQKMIRCATISSLDESTKQTEEKVRFCALLPKLYPLFHVACDSLPLDGTGLLYHWPGRDPLNPTVLLAHYDVAGLTEEEWQIPPFEAVIEDGYLWGRGVLDTKTTLCAMMEAAENLIEQGFVPAHDIYFAFSGNEEIVGNDTPAIVAKLDERYIRPALVLDEGGMIANKVLPGMKIPCALIGIGEKGMMDIQLVAEGQAGHASTPPKRTVIGKLARALVRIETHSFPTRLIPPTKQFLMTAGRYASWPIRLLMANLAVFKPFVCVLLRKHNDELNALFRTTTAITLVAAGESTNILPGNASAIINIRLLNGDTIESAVKRLKKVIKDPNISINLIQGVNPLSYADSKSEAFLKVSETIHDTWPDAAISPYLMSASTDSHYFCSICDNVLRFTPLELSAEEKMTSHGHNERIALENVGQAGEFYLHLIRKL